MVNLRLLCDEQLPPAAGAGGTRSIDTPLRGVTPSEEGTSCNAATEGIVNSSDKYRVVTLVVAGYCHTTIFNDRSLVVVVTRRLALLSRCKSLVNCAFGEIPANFNDVSLESVSEKVVVEPSFCYIIRRDNINHRSCLSGIARNRIVCQL